MYRVFSLNWTVLNSSDVEWSDTVLQSVPEQQAPWELLIVATLNAWIKIKICTDLESERLSFPHVQVRIKNVSLKCRLRFRRPIIHVPYLILFDTTLERRSIQTPYLLRSNIYILYNYAGKSALWVEVVPQSNYTTPTVVYTHLVVFQ